MKNRPFIHEDFMLESSAARELYHSYAESRPIIDFHNHLDPAQIASGHCFDNIGEVWLAGDHYKWRAMRAAGVDERYITGKDTSDREKFEKWAATVPMTMRNPLYHWTRLELKRVFGIDRQLDPATARDIYEECSAKLRTPDFSVRNLLRRFNVESLCTTDDPVSPLDHHRAVAESGFEVGVFPTWRPDRAMGVDDPEKFRAYMDELSEASGVAIRSFDTLIEALRRRHDRFAAAGCRLSDHGLDVFYAEEYTGGELDSIFAKAMSGGRPTEAELLKFRSAVLYEGAVMDWEKGWTQQFHIGPLRNNRTRMLRGYGPDAGCDSIGDWSDARAMSRFLDRLDSEGKLTRTIVYNLNPRDNDLIATMLANFQDGSAAGKMQFGSGWWFMDQKDGIEGQLDTLSNQGLLSRFVGMVTDSRSFLSYSRHEYFRRVLCNLLGRDVEKGLLDPSCMEQIGAMAADISYNNARNYFGFKNLK